MDLQRLTNTQRIIYTHLITFKSEKNKLPSMGDLQEVYKASRQAIYQNLDLLKKKGYVIQNEDRKFVPTSEGIEQYIKDAGKPERIKLTHK